MTQPNFAKPKSPADIRKLLAAKNGKTVEKALKSLFRQNSGSEFSFAPQQRERTKHGIGFLPKETFLGMTLASKVYAGKPLTQEELDEARAIVMKRAETLAWSLTGWAPKKRKNPKASNSQQTVPEQSC